VHQLDDALHRAGAALYFTPHFTERSGGTADEHGIQQELTQLTAGHAAGQNLMRTDPQHQRDGAEQGENSNSGEQGAHADPAHGSGKGGLYGLCKALPLELFERERLHRLDGVDDFAGQTAGIRYAILGGAGQAAYPPADDEQRDEHQRHQYQDQPGKHRAGYGQHDQAAAQRQRGA
jgi:hypothetical protein